MAIRSLRAPGMVAMRFTIGISPMGVFATNACCVTGTPIDFSCSMMYSRVRAMPGEPAGRGTTPTIWRRCSYARELSKAGGVGFCAERAEDREQREKSREHRATNVETRNIEPEPELEPEPITTLSRIPLHKIPLFRTHVNLPGTGDLLLGIAKHLFPLREPSRRAGDREEYREKVFRK